MSKLAAAVLAAVTCLSAGDLRLIEAVKRRDPKAVEGLLREKVDVNAVATDGGTALAWSVQFADRQMTDKLLAAGFEDVNVETWRVYDGVAEGRFASAFIRGTKPN